MKTIAAVLDRIGAGFVLREIDLEQPAADEVLIEIAGVGLCHTDIAVRDGHLPFSFPGVLGHEGSGTVREVGSDVKEFTPGDQVCLSFANCAECRQCLAGEPAYCSLFRACNFQGARLDGSTALSHDGIPLGGHFFGQSSFSRHVVANARNVVKVLDGIPLEIAGTFGCGLQTGAGAVMNAIKVTAGSTVLVAGGGSVGLSAVMAAAVQGAENIIVVEPVARRRELALQLGATHVFDPAAGPLSEQIAEIVRTEVEFAVDTTARPDVLREIATSMGHRGVLGLIGVPSNPSQGLDVPLLSMNSKGLTVMGICEGNSDRRGFIPKLMRLYLEGKFPFNKLVTPVPFAEIERGVRLQEQGDAVKVVLTIN